MTSGPPFELRRATPRACERCGETSRELDAYPPSMLPAPSNGPRDPAPCGLIALCGPCATELSATRRRTAG